MDNEEYLRKVQGSMKQRIDEISRCLDGDVLSFRELREYTHELIWSGCQLDYWLVEPSEYREWF